MAARRAPAGTIAALVFLLGAIVAACLPTGPSADPGSGSPSATPDPSGPRPKPTAWPTGVIEAAIALGAADGDFAKVGADLDAALASGDLEDLLMVTGDVIEFLEENQKNIPDLQGYPGTKALGDALAPAYATMLEGATAIRAALLAGDAAGVEAGFSRFVEGTVAYSELRQQVNEAAIQALFMKRTLVR